MNPTQEKIVLEGRPALRITRRVARGDHEILIEYPTTQRVSSTQSLVLERVHFSLREEAANLHPNVYTCISDPNFTFSSLRVKFHSSRKMEVDVAALLAMLDRQVGVPWEDFCTKVLADSAKDLQAQEATEKRERMVRNLTAYLKEVAAIVWQEIASTAVSKAREAFHASLADIVARHKPETTARVLEAIKNPHEEDNRLSETEMEVCQEILDQVVTETAPDKQEGRRLPLR